MDFIAALENPRIIRGIIEAISFLIDETYLYAYPSGVKMNAIDSSHVAMLLAQLPKEIFTEYECKEQFKIGLNVADISKILRRAKSEDTVELIRKSEEPNTLLIRMKSERSTRTFKLKSKEIQEYDEKEENIMETFEETLQDKFTSSISMEGPLLDEIIKDALIISDLIKVQIMSAESLINFLAYDESGEVEVELDLKGGGGGILDSEVKGDSEGLYSLNFLENIIKIQAVVDNFKISLGSNIPMKMEGLFGENGRIVYLLAPRVEDEEEDEFDEDFDAEDFGDDFDDDIDLDE
ncbi:MAG: proliferating cell nuclear antigen (pcna) [Candidatus Hodarchaeota archaeon]